MHAMCFRFFWFEGSQHSQPTGFSSCCSTMIATVANAQASWQSLHRGCWCVSRPSVATPVGGFLGKIFKQDPSASCRKKYTPKVEEINALEPQVQALSDDQLRAKTVEFKQRADGGESLESLLPEAFAVRVFGCVGEREGGGKAG